MHVLLDHVVLVDVLHTARAEPVHDALDEPLGRRCAGRDADGLDTRQPFLEDLRLVVDQMRRDAQVARHVDEALRVRGVRRADHEHQIDLARERLDGRLAVRRRVADVVLGGTDDRREAALQGGDDAGRLVDRERCLGEVRQALAARLRETSDILDGLHEHDRVGRLAHRADHFLVPGVADQEDGQPLAREALGLVVHLGHERAGRVDGLQLLAARRCGAPRARPRAPRARPSRPRARPPRSRRRSRPAARVGARRGCCARSACARRSGVRAGRASARPSRRRARRRRNSPAGVQAGGGGDGRPGTRPKRSRAAPEKARPAWYRGAIVVSGAS